MKSQGPLGYISLWLSCPLFLTLVSDLSSLRIRSLLYKETKQLRHSLLCQFLSHYCSYMTEFHIWVSEYFTQMHLLQFLIAGVWLDLHQTMTFSFLPKPWAFQFPPFLQFLFPWHKQFSRWKLLGFRVGQPKISYNDILITLN